MDDERASSGEAPAAASDGPLDSRRRVLIVDDEQALARSMARALAAYETSIAHDGAAALELMHAVDFDLVLCDVMMPGMGGREVYAALADDPVRLARIVFMTGGAFGDKAREFLDAVPNERLDKPFSIRELRAFVAGRLAR